VSQVRWDRCSDLLATLGLLTAIAIGCDADTGVADGTGAVTGTVRSYIVDSRDGKSRRLRFLELGDPVVRRVKLAFTDAPDVSAGDRLRVWGDERDGELVVSRFEKLTTANDTGADGLTFRSLTTVTPKTQKNAFVLIDVGGGVNLTTASATSTIFTPGKNFAGQYSLLSYGGAVYSGDILGPFSYPMTGCDWDGMATAMRKKVPTGYDHYMWYMGSMVNACDWSGLGSEGSAATPETESWFNRATDCGTLVQEVGHNNGWMHSSTLKCPGAPFADDPVGAKCTTDEYGNLYSPMGFGDCGHFVAMDKWYGGYFGGCNMVKVVSSGTFNLMPIEIPCNGIQGLQIAMPKTTRTFTAEQDDRPTALKNYYLELRVNGTPGETTLIKAPTVLVVAGDNLGSTSRASTHTFLLDMNPSTNSYDGLTAAGQSFSDPAGGLTFSVMSIDSTHATIQVTYTNGSGAGPTCMDGSMLMGPGPIDCGATTGTGGAGGGAGGAGGGAGGASGASGGAGRGGTGGGGGSTTGAAGRGGTTGSAGAGGRDGATGAAGTTGSAGTTGGAGTTGNAGTTGGGGTTGAAGTTASAGTTGTGGATSPSGVAGSIGPGIAGASGVGTGGSTGSGGQVIVTGRGGAQAGGAPGEVVGPITGGCACSTAPEGTGGWALAWLAFGLIAARRRKSSSR
jgi:MYXO-CTERM domain-containing protein